MCAKIHNFRGQSCTHFTRQWIQSGLPEHNDGYGRDGDTISGADTGGPGSAGTGTGRYSYRGQCIFFSSPNSECCATRQKWEDTSSNSAYCQVKFGERKDSWNSKHRSWRLATSTFSPTATWPVTSFNRRLSESGFRNATGEEPEVHELIFPDGSTTWVNEKDGAEPQPAGQRWG